MTQENLKKIKNIRIAGAMAASVLDELIKSVKPGLSTMQLNDLAESLIVKKGGLPGFKTVRGYQFAICTSVNADVVHGLPRLDQILKEGDILTIDIGVLYNGYHSDTAMTVPVGEVGREKTEFLKDGEKALYSAIKLVRPGIKVGELSLAIEKELKKYGIVPELTGHGVGKSLHEEPLIPNTGLSRIEGETLKEGMVIAIEPIYTNGSPEIEMLGDGWTLTSSKADLAAQFEHTVAVVPGGYEILTKRPGEKIS